MQDTHQLLESFEVNIPNIFDNWKIQAKNAILERLKPCDVAFNSDGNLINRGLFSTLELVNKSDRKNFSVPKSFFEFAKVVACYKDSSKWDLLYELLFRIIFEEKNLLDNPSDSLVLKLQRYRKSVTRDRHKMTAFVRFREVKENTFFAFYKPEHFISEFVASYFKNRFGEMLWSIATPYRTISWNKKELIFSSGIEKDPFSGEDNFEKLWCDYYSAIFNPARIKIKAMKNEMPVKYWSTMPETKLIPKLLKDAPKRVE